MSTADLVSWDECRRPRQWLWPSPIANSGLGAGTFARKIVKGGCFVDVNSQFDREHSWRPTLCLAPLRVPTKAYWENRGRVRHERTQCADR